MPRLYLDQDALIRVGRNTSDSVEVARRIADGRFTLVLSTAHWLDTAGGNSDDNSRELAGFIDSLRPLWLRERISLFRLECQNFLDGIPFEQTTRQAVCRTVTELVAEIGGLVGGGAAIVSSEAVVMELRRNGMSKRIFENSYTRVERAAEHNRAMYRAGNLTLEIELQARIDGLRLFARVVEGSDDDRRLQEAPPDALRALTCESEATKSYWRQSAGMTPNRVRDLFHLVVAMPHTDFILTYDQNLRTTMNDVADRVCFPVARIVASMGALIDAGI